MILGLLAAACGDQALGPAIGAVQVSVATTGVELDTNGYNISIDGGRGRAIAVNGTMTFAGLSPGSHLVLLAGLASNCGAVGAANPRSAEVVAGDTAHVAFSVTCVQSAPRTGQIAFVSESGCSPDFVGNIVGTCVDDIYVVNADGSNPNRLSSDYGSPVWSPNGTQVASGSYIMNADGSNPYWLPGNGDSPAWSPDGARIAFRSSGQIYVMNADGTNPTRLTSDGGITPAWSPNGTRIAFSSNHDGVLEIFVMNADGTNLTRLTDNSEVVDAWGPIWSPDGANIAFHTYGQVYVMNADGTNLVRLFNPTASFVGGPIWSPDGTKLVFSYSSNQIYVVNVDGTNLIRLGTSEPSGFEEPSWSLDGTKILLTTYLVWGYVYVVNADGSNLHKVAAAYGRATWSPDGMAIAVGARSGGSFPTISIMNGDGTGLASVCPCDPDALMSYDPAWRPSKPLATAITSGRTALSAIVDARTGALQDALRKP